jgi:hypothetical protein
MWHDAGLPRQPGLLLIVGLFFVPFVNSSSDFVLLTGHNSDFAFQKAISGAPCCQYATHEEQI